MPEGGDPPRAPIVHATFRIHVCGEPSARGSFASTRLQHEGDHLSRHRFYTGAARECAHEFDIVHLSERLVTRHNPRDGQAPLAALLLGAAAWTMRQAWQASVELLLLAHADAFVGKFTSNFFRAAYALRAAQCDCAPLFSSLDAPTCFDFGVRAGRNWEFPVENRVATKTVRLPNSSTFEC